ncbi:hypothetical protein CAPTEDRAFT_220408 [Capitella teleta]|uniref:Uncharacterized protein n=1 Tax=Capitella teleta TaxID=283909 RepID=R7VBK6_CAPTE|nr:hypothetical protein CAPTEDRAFT_220408 [Capitella teleta]|eukprot:ELU13666.1 hypothetical protein CAPTEDRAFT_220408 [Capitella teleta]
MAQSIQMPSLNWDHKEQQLAFTEWKDFLESYLVIHNVAEEKKWHYIVLSVGTKGREIWETWQLNSNQKADLSGIFKKFEEHLIGTPNKWVSRLELAALKQKDNESVEDFACRLRAKAKACKYEALHLACDYILGGLVRRPQPTTHQAPWYVAHGYIPGGLVVGTINKFHICMAQCLGSIEVGFSFTTFLLVRNASRDSLVRSSWLLSRVVLYSLCLIIELHTHLTSYTGPQRLTDQNFSAGVSCLGLCIIFTLYHVMRSGGTSRKRTGRLAYSMQTCILLMVIFLFVTSLADLAFPAQALAEVLDSAKADVIITYLIRSNGAFCLAYVIQMIASLRFDDDEDRLAFFKGNFLAIALQIPMIALYQWKDPVFNPYGIYVTGGGLVFMAMLNACALNRCLPSCCSAKAKTS